MIVLAVMPLETAGFVLFQDRKKELNKAMTFILIFWKIADLALCNL